MRIVRPLSVCLLLLTICFKVNAADTADAYKKDSDAPAAKPSESSAKDAKAAEEKAKPVELKETDGRKLFVEQIRPAFEQNCLDCHGGKKTRSGFDLSTREALLKGGENGPAIVLENAESSRLIKMLRHTEDPGMPYKKPKLDEAIISKVANWIALGAPYDAPLKSVEADAGKAKSHEDFWAVKPLAAAQAPKLDSSWVQSPIDAFVLAKLQEKKLSPTPEADRRTLIRRLSFDLHGLPPTPEEVEAFVADKDANAYEKLVDRLLASPRYGERWGRHWLDVVHYGDTHGYDKDLRRTNSWPYRDYVIKSLNEDKPYGRFACEQLAGDVLFPDEPDGIVATGFIVAGPWDVVGQTELKEDTMDKKITRLLDRDDMVANTISTFSSLTVHCARCHNHKFDPIPQKDYYSLQAVFAGVDRADRLYDPDKGLFNLRRTLFQDQATNETKMASLQNIRSRVSSAKIRNYNAELTALSQRISTSTQLTNAVPGVGRGYHSELSRSAYETKWVQVDLGQPFPLDEIILVPSHLKHGECAGPGFGFPRRFKIEVSNDPGFKTAQVVADETAADFPNPGDAPYLASGKHSSARYIRVTVTRLWRSDPKKKDWLFAIAELIAMSGDKNVARSAAVTSLDSHEDVPTWHPKYLVDGNRVGSVLFDPSPTDGYQSATATKADTTKWVQLDFGETAVIDQVALMSARPADAPEELGFGFPVRFRIEASNDPEFKVVEMIADKTSGDVENPGSRPMSFSAKSQRARYLRITATQLWKQKDKESFLLALGEIQVTSGRKNIARNAAVTALDSVEKGRWSTKYVDDGYSSLSALATLSPGDGFSSQSVTNADTVKWVQLDLGKVVPIEQVALVPIRTFESIYKPANGFGYGFPARYRVEISANADFEFPFVLADHTQADFPNPGSETQVISTKRKLGRYVRVTATRLWKKKDDEFLFALAEIQVISAKTNLATAALVSSSDSIETNRWGTKFIADGYDSHTLINEPSHPGGYKSADAKSSDDTKWVQLDLGKKYPVDTVRLFPAAVEDSRQPSGFPVRFRVETSNNAEFTNATVIFQSRTNFNLRDNQPFEISCDALAAQYVRITATRLSGRHGEYHLALAEVQVLSEGWNVARGAQVRALDSAESEGWSLQYLVDGFNRQGVLANTADVLQLLHQHDDWRRDLLKITGERDDQITSLLDDNTRRDLDYVDGRLADLDEKISALPEQKKVYAAASDFVPNGKFVPSPEPRVINLLDRGDVNKPGAVMKPAGLSCVLTVTNEFTIEASHEGERRAALARWITDPKNAITWRSIVNRVWSYHFGRGIVDSPNDFGNMGSTPTHPELLDWLATEFLAHGQSFKWLHKQIVTSATYRQASTFRDDYAKIDSGNQFLWRMNRERLDAESMRDTILSVSGKLDLTMGGPGYDLFEFKDDFSPHYYYDKYNVDDAKTMRRSIYRFIVRSVPDPLMETLDCADPSQSVPVRNTTITALQALSLLNNPFALRMSELFAARLKQLSPEPAQQIDWAFRLALGRKPTTQETNLFAAHTAKYGLPNTCRVIFNSNEFMFVD